MAESRTKQDFPEAKDKIVEAVHLSVEAGYYGITIRFQDSTSLTFSIEPCVVAFPIFSEWKNGEEKILKEYQPVRSEVSLAPSDTMDKGQET